MLITHQFFQVPSVFDDEVDSPTRLDGNNNDKIETWSSQYCKNESKLLLLSNCTLYLVWIRLFKLLILFIFISFYFFYFFVI